jgi:triacylglycerol esterase/lipase EstA (alpha/beta hydrolase family)
MHWLQQHRGNDFVQHVVAELDGKPSKATRFPIVLLHGFGASPGSFDSQIPAAMRADGDAVFEVTAPPYATPEERAQELAPQLEAILAKTGAAKLNLIAWSEGGLDARYLISSMGWADRVASLSTVATPHRGSANADKLAAVVGDTDAVLGHVHAALALVQGDLQQAAAKPKPATLPPALAPILTKLDEELGGVFGGRPVKLETLVNGPRNSAAEIKADLAGKAAELANKLAAHVPPSVEPTLAGIARSLGQQAGNAQAATTDPIGAMKSLSEADAAAFNQANPNKPGIYYQSWAGIATLNGKLTPAQRAELEQLGPLLDRDPAQAAQLEPKLIATAFGARSSTNGDLNDGAVGVKSAMWGNFQGTVPADHLDFATTRASDTQRTGFDATEFYRKIAEGLAKRGY